MTKLVINKGAVIKQLSAGTAGVINAHDQHSSSERLGLRVSGRHALLSGLNFTKQEYFLLVLSFFLDEILKKSVFVKVSLVVFIHSKEHVLLFRQMKRRS